VRSIPYSRRWPQFRREALAAALTSAGVDYVWLGEGLGGRPRDPALARERPTAIMCAERDPLDCHRFHLLAKPLVQRGANIVHLLGDGGRETQAEAEERLRHGR
jgi:uncharacterized protein (DUF488 family)